MNFVLWEDKQVNNRLKRYPSHFCQKEMMSGEQLAKGNEPCLSDDLPAQGGNKTGF